MICSRCRKWIHFFPRNKCECKPFTLINEKIARLAKVNNMHVEYERYTKEQLVEEAVRLVRVRISMVCEQERRQEECDVVLISVLDWWEEHQYDMYGGDRNVYDEDPDFVKHSKQLWVKRHGAEHPNNPNNWIWLR